MHTDRPHSPTGPHTGPFVTRILGLGFDEQDGHVRITQGDTFGVLLGSPETHRKMESLCLAIERALAASGRRLQDLTQEEFLDLAEGLQAEEPPDPGP